MRIALLLLLCSIVYCEEGIKLAKVDMNEIDPLLMQLVLADPQLATVKATLDKLSTDIDERQTALSGSSQAGDPKLKEMFALQKKKQEQEQLLSGRKRAVLLKAINSLGDKKYVAIFDSNDSETLIYKTVDIVDITMDIKDAILLSGEGTKK